jgi:hypothetical protein
MRWYYNSRIPVDWCGVCKFKVDSEKSSTLNGYFAQAAMALRSRDPDSVVSAGDLMTLWKRQRGRCRLTGIPMTHDHSDITDTSRHFTNASVDRIDSSVGYIGSNIQLVCQRVNYMKSNMPEELFLWTAARIVQHCTRTGRCLPDATSYEVLSQTPPHPAVARRQQANPIITECRMALLNRTNSTF